MGRLASANSGRNPSRTAATAAALMIGLALVTFVAVLASGLESSTKDDLTRQVKSDYVVVPDTSTSATYFDAATGPALASVPGVTSVSAVRSDKARVLGSTVSVNGIDGATIGGVYRFAWKDGSDAVLAHLGNGAIVDSKWAKTHKLSDRQPAPGAGVERHQADVRRPRDLPPEVPGRSSAASWSIARTSTGCSRTRRTPTCS